MKRNKILIAILTFVSIFNFTSCIEDGNFTVPESTVLDPNLTETMSIDALLASYSNQPIYFSDDTIISGYVASNDETGNIYKSLIIQDKAENPTAGVAISIDQTGLSSTYEQGRKVYVKMKGLVFSMSNNLPTIGAGIDGDFVTRITQPAAKEAVIRGTEIATIVPKPVLISQLKDTDLNQLITVKKAQFVDADLGLYYANPNNNDSENRTIIGCEDSGELILRNSGFASFRAVKLPEGSGEISGVLSRYNDDMQLYITKTEDVKFTDARCIPTYKDVDITTNTTLKIIKEKYASGITQISEDLVFEAYVTSSDKTGNIYKTLYIQDKPENPEHAIQILVDKTSMYLDYQIGRKVYIKAKDLYIDEVNGVLALGSINGLDLERIPEEKIKDHIIAGNATTIVPKEVTLEDIFNNDKLLSVLVKINDLQLSKSEVGSAYGNPSNNFTVNRKLDECTSSNSIIMRNSGYSTFKDQEFPTKKGSVVALVSKYNSTYQIYIRDTSDVDFTQDRCDPLFEEYFENTSGNISIDGWTNYAEAGTKIWQSYSDANSLGISARMGAYRSGDASNIAWLITPSIDLDAQSNEVLTFKTSNSFADSSNLEVLISTDWDGNEANITSATWVNLPATVVDNNLGYKLWQDSGDVDLSNYTGKAYIAFKYIGSGSSSNDGTYELDDIKIKAK